MLELGRILLVSLVGLFLAVAWRTLRRGASPVTHWMLGWAFGGVSGALAIAQHQLPVLQVLGQALGSLLPALLLSGTLVFAGRRVPGWWLPGAFAFGCMRTALAVAGHPQAGFVLGLSVESGVVVAAAVLAQRAAPPRDATWPERLLPAALGALALAGFLHLAWLASGGAAEQLVSMWMVVAPPVVAIQIQAVADRGQRELRRVQNALEERVAERTTELAASEERHRTISALTSDMAFHYAIDRENRVRFAWVSGAFERILGQPPSAFEGLGWQRFFEDPTGGIPLAFAAAEAGTSVVIEQEVRRPDGEAIWLEFRLATLRPQPDGSIDVLGAASDVTERKRAEEERRRFEQHMQQVQRLESLGVLAGGMAHDFNNLLTVIRGSARLALADPGDAAALERRLERIRDAAGHAAELTEQMLTYAGKAAPSLGPVDLVRLVDGMLGMVRASIPARSVFETQLPSGLAAVEGDAGQLRQVLLNLAFNAADAVGDAPGRILVRAGEMEADAAWLADTFGVPDAPPGRYVFLEVADDGCGMDPAVAHRLFEPFFTTKFAGRGLGMAAVLGIVRGHQGVIKVDTAPGRGTAVRVCFPPSLRRAADVETAAVGPALAPLRGTVLVIDDDRSVREVAAEMLERAGFAVVAAADGRTALEALRSRGEPIDAVLLDLTLPDLGGEEIFLRLRELRPGLPVVLMTGYDAERAAERFAAQGLDGFLRKPFEPEQLVDVLRHALAR